MRLPRVHLRLVSTAAVRLHPPPSAAIYHEAKDKKEWQLELEQHIARGQLAFARQVLDRIPAPDARAYNALIRAYSWRGPFHAATNVFAKMPTRDVVAWNAMLAGYAQHGMYEHAIAHLLDMQANDRLRPNASTLVSLLPLLAQREALPRGASVHAYCLRACLDQKEEQVLVGTALLDMYAKCKHLVYACRVFHGMAVRNEVTWNSLLSMYAKAGLINETMALFDEMAVKDTVSYGALLSGYVQNGKAEEAFIVFKKMQACNVEPDVATMVSLIPACSHLAALQHGRCSHGSVVVRGFASETSISNALIDMYAKCGRIDLSRQVFDKMAARDIVSWNTMIAGYGIHGLGKEATTLFLGMKNQGFAPDDVTFICLISACSHSGLVTEGKHWFNMMTQKHAIPPRMEHYICMVDLLARGGFLDEAYQFIQSMPLKADVRVWGALLGACRIHKNIDLGKQVSRMIQKLGPEGTGRFDEAAEIRVTQKVKGFKKSPGCSWIEINGSLHAFVGGDQSHPRAADIYQELDNILIDIKKLGYQADTSFVLQDLEEEEKEKALLYHSEKLAIAFGILSLGEDKAIFVTKNLRVCGDCHTAIKYMTLVRNRAIIVRDANRFHHFKNGQCSCGDFW
ncbi:hypothetical protein HU200_044257 [Digitaria exilis]|uniref:DYW domain-containing protein n=1 Tax=Digitaria exilis TaxID=1010633 RepID=A0A835AZ87_9POAL|nr:hypothetical protein HU200_044257 [Digitaria exilis]